ncbi:nonstructural protein [Dipodfec virus RodF1_53]|uniref:Nonstructural protein n=1 Tax=Dipodfec virus RodF1_53 TaxID=2929302 RepID=A0A976R7X3_9VIRU|nr:nonstructural protein [Dipodfec virus RodF1_53]
MTQTKQNLTKAEKEFFSSHGVKEDEVKFSSNSEFMYSIYDTVSGLFDAPFLSSNNGLAIRFLSDTLNRGDNVIRRHPSDYKLYLVGSYVRNDGIIVPLSKPKFIINISDVLDISTSK